MLAGVKRLPNGRVKVCSNRPPVYYFLCGLQTAALQDGYCYNPQMQLEKQCYE